jgi:hypothetical protein
MAGRKTLESMEKASNAAACCRSLTKVDSAKDMLNWTAVEDREVQRCHEPVVRHTRTETVMLKVRCSTADAWQAHAQAALQYNSQPLAVVRQPMCVTTIYVWGCVGCSKAHIYPYVSAIMS